MGCWHEVNQHTPCSCESTVAFSTLVVVVTLCSAKCVQHFKVATWCTTGVVSRQAYVGCGLTVLSMCCVGEGLPGLDACVTCTLCGVTGELWADMPLNTTDVAMAIAGYCRRLHSGVCTSNSVTTQSRKARGGSHSSCQPSFTARAFCDSTSQGLLSVASPLTMPKPLFRPAVATRPKAHTSLLHLAPSHTQLTVQPCADKCTTVVQECKQ